MTDTLTAAMPNVRPQRPHFSSGPCAKRPGWTPDLLAEATVGRSHRSKQGQAKLKAAIDETKALLELPDDYGIAIVPASDTGAVEAAMWSMLGARGVDIFAWESFGAGWISDAVKELKLEDVRLFEAGFGELPDLTQYDGARDCVFTWNGTTSGVRVPNADWIPADRQGLTICDATSAAFAQDLDWSKLDVTTFSWQKVMGGEAAHGMMVLSPRAIERLESYTPTWPLPKVFRLTKKGKFDRAIFEGSTLNTPSMLAVEDYLQTLAWARDIGGLKALQARADANAAALGAWVERTAWIEFLARDPAIRSNTSVCLQIVGPWFKGLSTDEQAAKAKKLPALLESEGVAFDIGAYRAAPPGLRIWCGSTVEKTDIEALCPWLDWAFAQLKQKG